MTTTRSDIFRCESCGTKNRVPASATGVPKCGKCGSPLPWVTEAGDDDFDDIAMTSKVPVLVDLWAEWCPPCRMVSPVLDQMAKERAGQLKLVKVNVDNWRGVRRPEHPDAPAHCRRGGCWPPGGRLAGPCAEELGRRRPGRHALARLRYSSAFRPATMRKMSPKDPTSPWRRRIMSATTPVQPVW